MSKFYEATVKAVGFCIDGTYSNPVEAWKNAVEDMGLSEHTKEKGCPKNTFLGICEEGLVKGIAPGRYTKSKKNKKYGMAAVELLKDNPNLTENINELWKEVLKKVPTEHNSQMDVVIALWKNNLVKR
jgi:hypothetical protein